MKVTNTRETFYNKDENKTNVSWNRVRGSRK